MQRRDFIEICAATAAIGAQTAFAVRDLKPRFHSRMNPGRYGSRPLSPGIA